MKILNRQTEVALNILQLMYKSKLYKSLWTICEIADRLKESELYTFQILRRLRISGYIQSIRGNRGGYILSTEVEYRRFATFLQDFNKEPGHNPTLCPEFASEYANSLIYFLLHSTMLVTILTANKGGSPAPEPLGVA